MQYPRVFLSHAWTDKPLVEEVAHALARRGVIAWLDIHELYPGLDLGLALARAIDEHTLVAVFLSEAALRSPWVNDELAAALAQEQTTRPDQQPTTVVPVFLGKGLDLVRQHPRLRTRWLHPDGDRVVRLGIKGDGHGDTIEERAQRIADELAPLLYRQLDTAACGDLALIIDQRGDGKRAGLPDFVPSNLAQLDIPALVFRPGLGVRSRSEVLRGEAWEQAARDMVTAVRQALGPRRPEPRKIRILGASQLALPLVLGRQLDRTYGAALYCYDRRGALLSLDLAAFEGPLTGGRHDCARTDQRLAALPLLAPGARTQALVLLVLKDEDTYLQQAAAYLQAHGNTTPVAWIPHAHEITTSEDVVRLAGDIKAFVGHAGARRVELLTSLPFHALPLLGALLSPHVFDQVVFLEQDREAVDAGARYHALPLP